MKVAIIGAGICGLYLGWKLSRNGHQVTIFEKRDRIGKEVCSGLFSERILDFIPQSEKLIQNQIEHCLIHLPERQRRVKMNEVHRLPERSEGWSRRRSLLLRFRFRYAKSQRRTNVLRLPRRTLKIKFSRKFLVMSHSELDNLVAELAQRAGAKIRLNSDTTSPGLVGLQKEFDRIVGCDGANSMVRRSLNLKEPNFFLAIQGFISKEDNSNYAETWPTDAGFLWKIPRGEETEYGIIEKPKRANPEAEPSVRYGARVLFEKFLGEKGIELERTNSAIVPQGLIIPKNPKVTLCGDAAGLTKPWSGGGVIWGLTAANLLLKNFPDFIKYQKETRRFFLPKIILSKTAKKLVYFLGFNLPWLLPKNVKIESDFLI